MIRGLRNHLSHLFLYLQVFYTTIVRLKQLARSRIEILQLEVARSFQRHSKTLGVPASLPQDVLGKASRPRADVTEVQQLAFTVLRQGSLHNERLYLGGRHPRTVHHTEDPTHPLAVLWVGEHVVKAVVDVCHLHGCSKYTTIQ